jgi:hypothetical protein
MCPELIKQGTDILWGMLRKLYERCINGEYTPEEWRMHYITPIHKKGSQRDPKITQR